MTMRTSMVHLSAFPGIFVWSSWDAASPSRCGGACAAAPGHSRRGFRLQRKRLPGPGRMGERPVRRPPVGPDGDQGASGLDCDARGEGHRRGRRHRRRHPPSRPAGPPAHAPRIRHDAEHGVSLLVPARRSRCAEIPRRRERRQRARHPRCRDRRRGHREPERCCRRRARRARARREGARPLRVGNRSQRRPRDLLRSSERREGHQLEPRP